MESLDNELKYKQLYERLGILPDRYISDGQIINIFKKLHIAPDVYLDGKRRLTPYEILGVAPIFDNQGNEIPIVFAIKNRAEKVTKNTSLGQGFIYQSRKIKKDKDLLQEMTEKYKRAVLYGNNSDAEMYFQMLDDISGGKAKEILSGFYDYSKFYRRMKKQLLIDVFAHFFLMYISSRKSLIKNGILKRNKIYRAYHEEYEETSTDVFEFDLQNQNLNFGADIPIMQSIKITTSGFDDENENTPPVESKPIEKDAKPKDNNQEIKKPKKDLTKSVINVPKKIRLRRFKLVESENNLDKNKKEKNERIRGGKALINS